MVHADLDAGRLGGQAGPGQRLVHQLVDVHGRQLGQPLRACQPGQRDQLGDQRAEPGRLREDPPGEAADLGGVVRGVEHGLGQQPHRADRRLQLVADVGHEVAAGGLQPHGVRAVGGLDHGEPVAEPADVPEHGGGLAATPLQRRQVDLDRRPGGRAARHLPAGRPGARIGDTAPDDAELDRLRVVQHHLAGHGQHGQPGLRRAEHPQQQVRQRRARVVGGSGALVTRRCGPPGESPTEHGSTAEAGQQRDHGQHNRRQHTHRTPLRSGGASRSAVTLFARCAPHGRIVGARPDKTGPS